jgi:hypothetical protein
MTDIGKLVSDAWSATFDEVRTTSLKILKDSGQDSYNEMRPFLENLWKWSADYALSVAQDDPSAEQARAMIISQLEMIAVHLSHDARRAFYAMVEKDLLLVARVIGSILKQALIP